MKALNKWILQIAGTMEVIIGIAHFGMPYFAFQSPGFSQLNPEASDFITLCILAIGILLVGFGLITTFTATVAADANKALQTYTLIKACLFGARIILEILYPVSIPLFLIATPSTWVMTLLIVVWVLFVVSAILTSITFKKEGAVHEYA